MHSNKKNIYLIMITKGKVQEFKKKKLGKTDQINILTEKNMILLKYGLKYLINLNNINSNL